MGYYINEWANEIITGDILILDTSNPVPFLVCRPNDEGHLNAFSLKDGSPISLTSFKHKITLDEFNKFILKGTHKVKKVLRGCKITVS